MTLRDALNENKGIGPGFNFLRHALSISIILFHARQLIYWQHGAELLAAAGVTDPSAAAEAAINGPVHFTLQEIVRPVIHSLLGMFFGLSGFLIAGSAVRTATVGKFFANRALRIFPALGAETLLSAFILGPLITVLPLKAYFTDFEFRRYLGNMVGWIYYYLPGVYFYPAGIFHNPMYKTINGQLWTLPSELKCYIMMLFLVIIKIIKQPRVFLAISGISMIAMVLLFSYDPINFNPKDQNFFTPWYLVVIFWFGVSFFLNAELIKLKLSYFMMCVALYWAAIFFNIATPLSGIFLTYSAIYIGFTKFPWWDKFIKGDYSYGMFLYHLPIMQAILHYFLPYWNNVPLIDQFAMLIALCVPSTIAFAAISWRFVEKPALSLREVFAKTKAVAPEGPANGAAGDIP